MDAFASVYLNLLTVVNTTFAVTMVMTLQPILIHEGEFHWGGVKSNFTTDLLLTMFILRLGKCLIRLKEANFDAETAVSFQVGEREPCWPMAL